MIGYSSLGGIQLALIVWSKKRAERERERERERGGGRGDPLVLRRAPMALY